MKILIIGGTGNISRWFVHMLAERGDDITLYNRGRTASQLPAGIQQIIGDRTDVALFRQQMAACKNFDCVIDMVGFEPREATTAIDIFSGRTGQFIFCSTVDVYSKQQTSYPVPADQPVNASPTFSYAYKKMQMEQILLAAHEAGRLPVTIIRPAATYSEGFSPLLTPFGRQHYHLERLRKGEPVILHGDGSSIWVETHSSDVARAFILAIGNPVTLGKAYNVTGDELLTWRSMHTIVAEELGAPVPSFICLPSETLGRIVPVESEWCLMNFQYNNIFDSFAAKRDLGFAYTISYREGVRRCLAALPAVQDTTTPAFYETIIQKWINQWL